MAQKTKDPLFSAVNRHGTGRLLADKVLGHVGKLGGRHCREYPEKISAAMIPPPPSTRTDNLCFLQALTGATNSITMFAFTDEAYDNVFNNTFDYKELYDFDITTPAVQGGVINNHMLRQAVNIPGPSDDESVIADLVTYPTALTAADPSQLTTLDNQVITPITDGPGVTSGLLYSEVIDSKATE